MRKLKCLFVCNNKTAKITTIPDEFALWNAQYLLASGEVRLVWQDELKDMSGTYWDIFVYDEFHLINITRAEFFNKNKCASILLMTGTEPSDSWKRTLIKTLTRGSVKFNLNDSVKHKVVNDYIIKVVMVDADDTIKFKRKGTAEKMTEWGHYINACKKVEAGGRFGYKGKMQAGVGRMWLIKKSITKLKAVMYLNQGLKQKNDMKRLIFTTSQDRCDLISEHKYYSGLAGAEITLKAFQEDKIKEMVTVNMLKEGANLNGVLRGVVQQVDNKDENFLQKLGRFLRGDVNGTPAEIYVVCLANTVDVDWVKKSLSKIPKEKIQTHNLSKEMLDQIQFDWEPFV